jgi:hypothetical protein
MSEIIISQIGDVRWHLFPEYSEGLGPIFEEMNESESPVELDDKKELQRGTRFRLIREDTDGRRLYGVKANHPGLPGELWIKIYKPRNLKDYIQLNRGASLLDREWKMSLEHKNRSLPIPQYLAMGRRLRNNRVVEIYLIHESLSRYQTFDQYYRYTFKPAFPEPDVGKKRMLIKELASIARKMHNEGVYRPGLLPSQIVLASRDYGMAALLTNPEQAEIILYEAEGPSLSRRIEALALLDSNFGNLFNQSYRLRFYREYFQPDNLDRAAFKRAVSKIMARSEDLNQSRLSSVTKNITRRREPYYWFRAGKYRVFINGPVYENSLVDLVDSLQEIIEKKKTARIKIVGDQRPVETILIQCLSRLHEGNGSKGGALHGLTMAAFLKERGLPHLEALAAVQARSRLRSFKDKGYLILRKPQASCLSLAEHLARKLADEFSGLQWDRADLVSLAHFMRRMHEMNMIYSPASGTDIWVRSSENRGKGFMFANPQNLSLKKDLSWRDMARHLAEFFFVLPISEADKLTVLQEYIRFFSLVRGRREGFLAEFTEISQRLGKSEGAGS